MEESGLACPHSQIRPPTSSISELFIANNPASPDLCGVRKRKSNQAISSKQNPCRALILIDGGPVRRKACKDYEKALHDLRNAREQLDCFEKEHKPRFMQWLNRHFGALLTKLRETSQQLAEKEHLIFQVESEVLFSGHSYGKAYQRVMRWRENPAAAETEFADGKDSQSRPTPAGDKSADGFGSDSGDPMDDSFNSFFEEMEDDFDDRYDGGRRGKKDFVRETSQRPPASTPRLKEFYRALVRRLHPDTQTEMTGQKLEWWHQAQRAYQEGNAEELEVLLTLCEIEDRGNIAQTSVSLLVRITRQFASSLRTLKKQLKQCQSEPAWNFSRRTDLDRFSIQMRRTLEEELFVMQRTLGQMEAQLNRWAAEADRIRSRKPRRRRAPVHQDFLF
jgi:hypothetical protein